MTYFEIAIPYRTTFSNKQKAKDFIKLYNTHKNIYKTIYTFNKKFDDRINYNSAIVDKLFFDLDNTERSWDDLIKLHQYCLAKDILHSVKITSIDKYHVFVYCTNATSNINLKQSQVGNAQNRIIDKTNIECDVHVIGDLARVSRVADTYNVRRKAWCVWLSKADISKGKAYCNDLTRKQRFIKLPIIGRKRISLKNVPTTQRNILADNLILTKEVLNKINTDNVLKDIAPCIAAKLISDDDDYDCGYKERYLIIMYLKDAKHFLLEETREILKKYIPKEKFEHCWFEEKQIQYLYKRNFFFPSCELIKEKGGCIREFSKCKFYNSVYKKMKSV